MSSIWTQTSVLHALFALTFHFTMFHVKHRPAMPPTIFFVLYRCLRSASVSHMCWDSFSILVLLRAFLFPLHLCISCTKPTDNNRRGTLSSLFCCCPGVPVCSTRLQLRRRRQQVPTFCPLYFLRKIWRPCAALECCGSYFCCENDVFKASLGCLDGIMSPWT